MMIQISQTTLDFKNHQVKMKYKQDVKNHSLPSAAILPTFSRSGREKKKIHYLKANNLTSSGSHLL